MDFPAVLELIKDPGNVFLDSRTRFLVSRRFFIVSPVGGSGVLAAIEKIPRFFSAYFFSWDVR
jgi:hypothetical protein